MTKYSGDRIGANAFVGEPLEGHGKRSFLQIASAFMRLATADMMPIFGDIGQMREVAEGANHRHHLIDREVLQKTIECLAGRRIALETVGDRELADPLDQVEGLLAFLFSDHIPQQTTEEANI